MESLTKKAKITEYLQQQLSEITHKIRIKINKYPFALMPTQAAQSHQIF